MSATSSAVMSQLLVNSNTTYYVFARSAESANYHAGTAQRSLGITTDIIITWHADGGMPIPTQTSVNHGGAINAPAEMTKTGYTFGGWYSDAGFTIPVTFPIADVITETTLYAKWTINTYSVTWSTDGGMPIPTQTSVNHGDNINAPEEMTKTGYTFGGWYSDAGFTTEVLFPITNVVEAITFYAKWVEDGVGVLENEMGNIRVYPNPTTEKLKIESGKLKIENVEVFDMIGKRQKVESGKQNAAGEVVIDISDLSVGVYFVKIHTEKGEVIRKVVKE